MAQYSNKDFGSDLKKAYKKSTPKKKKMATMPGPRFGGTTQKSMNSAMRNTKVIGAPMAANMPMPNNANPSWVKQKKSKGKKAKASKKMNDHDADDMKKAKGSKKKVSHVEQKKSMCKACKTSHMPGAHKKSK